jgi:hypothetical protein
MTPQEIEKLAKEVGKVNADIVVAFSAIIRALRAQPNFSDAQFKQNIKKLTENPRASDFTKGILKSVIE